MYEIHYIDDNKPEWLMKENIGGYNDKPPNLKKSSEEEFWRKFRYKVPSLMETRQIRLNKNFRFLPMDIFWYDDMTGMVIAHGKKINYFKCCVCEHDFQELKKGKCWRAYTCRKCGYSYEVDSSG